MYASRPTDVRMEIIDGIVYISPFIRNRPQGYKYPEVFRYDPHSIPAQVASLEFEREFGLLSKTKVRFDSGTQMSSLQEHLKAKGWDLTAGELEQRCRSAVRSLRVLNNFLGDSRT